MPRRPTGRRRGGQPGNHNRLKHGMYARKLPIEQELHLETLGLNRSHLPVALARARLKHLLTQQAAADPRHFLSYERAIQYYLGMISRLIRRNGRLSRETGIDSNELLALVDQRKDM